jgi:hypothetical protein
MGVTRSARCAWLLLVFSLPASRASQRVEVWLKLQRYGTLPLRSSGHVLPNSPSNQEKLEWLAGTIRGYKGEASVLQVQTFDDLPEARLRQLFIEACSRHYDSLLHQLNKIVRLPHSQRPARQLSRLRRRFHEIAAIDFFANPLRPRVEALLERADKAEAVSPKRKAKAAEYRNRLWITRPRPGIDRVSSAWLIERFIDPKARFAFTEDPATHPEGVPFDMFSSLGFGHRNQDCTFETLCKEFAIRDGRVRRIAQIIHDADLGDEKFGRLESVGLDQVLNGWARQDVSNDELLRRGMDLIEGLYYSSEWGGSSLSNFNKRRRK